jgi:hypothetical protein
MAYSHASSIGRLSAAGLVALLFLWKLDELNFALDKLLT